MRALSYSIPILILGAGFWFSFELYQSGQTEADPLSLLPAAVDEVLVVNSIGAASERLGSATEGDAPRPERSLFKRVSKWSVLLGSKSSDEQDAALYGAAEGSSWLICFQDKGIEFEQLAVEVLQDQSWSFSNGMYSLTDSGWYAVQAEGWISISSQKQWLNLNAENTLISDSNFLKYYNQRGKPALMTWMHRTDRWSVYDLAIKKGKLLINGFSAENRASLQSPATRPELPNFPPLTHSVRFSAIPSDAQLWDRVENEFAGSDRLAERNRMVSEIENSLGVSLRELLFDWPGKAVCQMEFGNHQLIAVACNDAELGLERLKQIADTSSVNSYLSHELFTLRSEIPADLLLGTDFSLSIRTFAIHENRVLFSNSSEAIQNYLESSELGRLQSFESLADGMEFISRNSSQTVFLRGEALSAHPLWKELFPGMDADESSSLVANISDRNEEGDYLNVCLSGTGTQNETESPDGERWALPLPETFTRKPELLINHYTGEKEILIQDKANALHLISAQGKLLWTRKMEDPIIGSVTQVDLFKNGKFQMVFTAGKHIHCLDRTGRHVEGFPVSLPAEASSALAVFDYDNNRDYRFLAGCADGKIYNYGSKGKAIRGWNHKAKGGAPAAIEHFRIGSKDYILALTAEGGIRLLQRNGEDRVPVSSVLEGWDGKHYLLRTESNLNSSAILFATKDGGVRAQRFDGKQKLVLETGEALQSVLIADLNEDNVPEIMLSRNREMRVYEINGNLVWKKEFESNCDDIAVYSFGRRDKRIGMLCEQEIWLLDAQGNSIEGFPIPGNTPLTIGDLDRNGEFHLIYGNAGRFVIDRKIK